VEIEIEIERSTNNLPGKELDANWAGNRAEFWLHWRPFVVVTQSQNIWITP
jgi:hypothetical protein